MRVIKILLIGWIGISCDPGVDIPEIVEMLDPGPWRTDRDMGVGIRVKRQNANIARVEVEYGRRPSLEHAVSFNELQQGEAVGAESEDRIQTYSAELFGSRHFEEGEVVDYHFVVTYTRAQSDTELKLWSQNQSIVVGPAGGGTIHLIPAELEVRANQEATLEVTLEPAASATHYVYLEVSRDDLLELLDLDGEPFTRIKFEEEDTYDEIKVRGLALTGANSVEVTITARASGWSSGEAVVTLRRN